MLLSWLLTIHSLLGPVTCQVSTVLAECLCLPPKSAGEGSNAEDSLLWLFPREIE